MELKELIPLLVIGGSAIFSLYKSKRKGAKSNDDSTSPTKSVFESFFEPENLDSTMEDEETDYRKRMDDESSDAWWQESISEEQPIIKEEAVVEEVRVKPQREERHVSAPISNGDITKNHRQDLPNFKSRSDVRKGVIFGVIFERPTF